MRRLPALLLFAAAQTCAYGQVPECFVGRWKSDEALTLADMRKHPEVTEKARALFENKFFGRLILIFGARRVGSYFEEQGLAELTFKPVDAVATGPKSMTLRGPNEGLVQWACEDGRIYAVVTRWEFREYFLPLP